MRLAAAAFEHCVTPAIFANSPGGSVALMPDSSLSESERENVSVNGEYAPAVGFVVPAVNDGENGFEHPVMLNDEDGLAAAAPYGVIIGIGRERTAALGIGECGQRSREEVHVQRAERQLRIIAEHGGQLARCWRWGSPVL